MDAAQDSTALTLAVACVILLFAGSLWLLITFGPSMTSPVVRSSRTIGFAAQFSLREVLILLAQFQVLGSILCWWCGDAVVGAMACVGVGAVWIAAWWHAAAQLTRHRIDCHLRRTMVLHLATPLRCIAVFAAIWINGHAVLESCAGKYWPLAPWLAANLVVMVTLVICQWVSAWVFRRSAVRFAVGA